VVKYKKDKTSVVTDALSRRHVLFSKLSTQILGFDHTHELYSQDCEFSSIFSNCQTKPQGGYYVSQEYLFKEEKLCMKVVSLRHFGIEKTLSMLKEKFFWPHMGRDVQRYCYKCIACLQAKSRVMPHGLYTLFPVTCAPWKDINIDFVLGLPIT